MRHCVRGLWGIPSWSSPDVFHRSFPLGLPRSRTTSDPRPGFAHAHLPPSPTAGVTHRSQLSRRTQPRHQTTGSPTTARLPRWLPVEHFRRLPRFRGDGLHAPTGSTRQRCRQSSTLRSERGSGCASGPLRRDRFRHRRPNDGALRNPVDVSRVRRSGECSPIRRAQLRRPPGRRPAIRNPARVPLPRGVVLGRKALSARGP